MIRRIILFLWLLLIAFFVYRRYDQPAADTLLYKVRTLSFNKSTYTTSIDGVPCPECDQSRLSSSSTKKATSSPQATSTTTSTNSTSPTLSSQDQAEAEDFLQALYQD